MMTEEGKAETDRAAEAFNRRLASATSVMSAPEIDWDAYKAKLPTVNIDALRADYEKTLKAIPVITYDESKDKVAHEAKEKAWSGFAQYCSKRVEELETLAAEQKDHKMHRWYRRRRVWQRFPGLYESLHNKVRGEWDNELWATYISYKALAQPLPWDPSAGDVTSEVRSQIVSEMSAASGIKPEELVEKESK
jgi:hypothetical protein